MRVVAPPDHLHIRVLQCVAVCCSVLQCVAVCCPTRSPAYLLNNTATHCNTLVAPPDHLHIRVLQCVAVCCSVLQCVAVCCPTRSSAYSIHTGQDYPAYSLYLRVYMYKNCKCVLRPHPIIYICMNVHMYMYIYMSVLPSLFPIFTCVYV